MAHSRDSGGAPMVDGGPLARDAGDFEAEEPTKKKRESLPPERFAGRLRDSAAHAAADGDDFEIAVVVEEFSGPTTG